MKSDPIQDFILLSERNLNIAVAVADAWPEAREQLTSSFLNKLGCKLVEKLKDWKYAIDGRFFIDQWTCLNISKPAWGDDYCISLQCWNYGEKMAFGVVRDEKHLPKLPICPEILNKTKTRFPSARQVKWWEAQVTMRSPAPDWQKPDVLWRMHTEKEFLDDVAEQLLQVAKISEPIIDRLVEKK